MVEPVLIDSALYGSEAGWPDGQFMFDGAVGECVHGMLHELTLCGVDMSLERASTTVFVLF